MRRSHPEASTPVNPRNGIQLPGVVPQQAQLQIAQPLNDVQLVAMIAGQVAPHVEIPEEGATAADLARKAVELAVQVVAHAAIYGNAAALVAAADRIRAARPAGS